MHWKCYAAQLAQRSQLFSTIQKPRQSITADSEHRFWPNRVLSLQLVSTGKNIVNTSTCNVCSYALSWFIYCRRSLYYYIKQESSKTKTPDFFSCDSWLKYLGKFTSAKNKFICNENTDQIDLDNITYTLKKYIQRKTKQKMTGSNSKSAIQWK